MPKEKDENPLSKKLFNPKEYTTFIVGNDEPQPTDKLTHLISLLVDPRNKDFKNDALKLIKQKGGLDLLVYAIKQSDDDKTTQALVASVWEAGIDATSQFSFFIDLAIKKNYFIALEAMTVIEDMESIIPPEELKKAIADIKNTANNKADDKQRLLDEQLLILKGRL